MSAPPTSEGNGFILTAIAIGLLVVGFGVGLGWPHLLTRVPQVAPDDADVQEKQALAVVALYKAIGGPAFGGAASVSKSGGRPAGKAPVSARGSDTQPPELA